MSESRIIHLVDLKDNANFQQTLQEVQQRYAATSDEVEAEQILREGLGALGFTVQRFGGSNNKNFLVTNANSPQEKLIVQICKKSTEAESGFQAISTGAIQNWQPRTYGSASGPVTDGMNNNDVVHVVAMELCSGSLNQKIELAEQQPAARIKFAVSLGQQLSAMLTNLSDKGVIWTDIKPGNLLMRGSDQIVVVDTKGIQDPDKLIKRKNGSIMFADLTEPFLSEDFLSNRQMNTKPADVRATWEREYSYQVAAMLHYAVTGEYRHSTRNAGAVTTFDFTNPIFQTAEGKRLQVVIEKLGDNDPSKRIRHADAGEMLKVLHDPAKFAQKKAVAENNVVKGPSLARSKSPEQYQAEVIAMEKMKAATAQLNASKIDERLAREKENAEASKRNIVRSSYDKLRGKVAKVSKQILSVKETPELKAPDDDNKSKFRR